jgi:hypothetical protein
MSQLPLPPGFQDMLSFGFIEALMGRRSRRFFMGAEIPDGVFAFKSHHQPVPLSELEKILVLSAVGGNTGWQYLIPYNDRYAPYLPNYASPRRDVHSLRQRDFKKPSKDCNEAKWSRYAEGGEYE